MTDESENIEDKVTGPVTKDLVMKYTFLALCVLAAIAVLAFGLNDFAAGINVLIMEIIGVLAAVASDYLLSRLLKEKGPLNTYSAAVTGLIAALSFSSGIPESIYSGQYIPTMDPTIQFVAVALISVVAVVLFKKVQGLLGRKYVNPVALTKLMVLIPIWTSDLIPRDHLVFSIANFQGLQVGLDLCFSVDAPFKEPLLTLTVLKNHGWLGGASSIAVIVVGIALFFVCRGYLKWRIPVAFLVTTAVVSAGYGFFYGEDVIIRAAYHLFIGSVIFLAFFMATDPPTSPLTNLGQIIFAIGLGVLTFALEIWGNLLGGSILALVLMNLTVPLLDRVGVHEPREWVYVDMLPTDHVEMYRPYRKTTDCIRCSKCIGECPIRIHPILIFEALERGDLERAKSLHITRCIGCGICSYGCPSGIPLAWKIQKTKQEIT